MEGTAEIWEKNRYRAYVEEPSEARLEDLVRTVGCS